MKLFLFLFFFFDILYSLQTYNSTIEETILKFDTDKFHKDIVTQSFIRTFVFKEHVLRRDMN